MTRFTHWGTLTDFAGFDPRKKQIWTKHQKSVRTSKKSSPNLRKTLFQIMDSLIKHSPIDDPVYGIHGQKRAQGRPYYVYMTINANKFLRIYYGRVKEYLLHCPKRKKAKKILYFYQIGILWWSGFVPSIQPV